MSITRALLETLGFGATDPIGAFDNATGLTPTTNGRRPGLLVYQGDPSGIGSALDARNWAYTGAAYTPVRTPTKWLAVATAAVQGTTTIWTPAAGKKFRLHGWRIIIGGNASLAVAATIRIWLADGGVDVNLQDVLVQIPAAAGAGPTLYIGPTVLLSVNGYLSTAANNVLAVQGNAAAALVTGQIGVQVFGSEE